MTAREPDVADGTRSGSDGFVVLWQCGSRHCRRQSRVSAGRHQDHQERYRGNWVPALQHGIESL